MTREFPVLTSVGNAVVFENCFAYPSEWDDESKARYLGWMARLDPDDSRLNESLPWE